MSRTTKKKKKFAALDDKDLAKVNGGWSYSWSYSYSYSWGNQGWRGGTRAQAPGIRSATPANGRVVVPVGIASASPVPVVTTSPPPVATGPAAVPVAGAVKLAI
jgi:hypothetical protein